MKIVLSLFVCIFATVSADRIRAPVFVEHNGILVRSDSPFLDNSKDTLPEVSTRDSRFPFGNGRIVGGDDAEENGAQWVVSLQWGVIRPAHFCGAALIAPNWVLTAAHCTMAFRDYGISSMVAGLHHLFNFNGNEQIRQVWPNQIFNHEDWDGFIGPFDIGLVSTAIPFVLDHAVNPIALPDVNEIHSGNANLHGWGSTSNSFVPNFPNVLQTIVKPIVPMATCIPILEGEAPITDRNVCTGPLTGGSSGCSGDSGSPLEQNGELVGIVNWNYIPCGQPNRPTVYARVSAYVTWINSTMSSST